MCEKRNNEIVRRILLELENAKEPMPLLLCQFLDFPKLDEELLKLYIERLLELNFIEVEGNNTYQITWDGHDFLGFSKDPIIWKAANQVAGNLSLECFISILKDLMFWKARKLAEEFSKKT